MKTTQINLRLEDGDIAFLDKLAGRALNRQAVCMMILQAGMEAIQENQGNLTFPIKFDVSNPSNAVLVKTETTPPRKR